MSLFCEQQSALSYIRSSATVMSMGGWMTCDFTSLSAVFQSYQDVRRVIIKCCLQWKPYTIERISPLGITLGKTRLAGQMLAGQRLTHKATVAPKEYD